LGAFSRGWAQIVHIWPCLKPYYCRTASVNNPNAKRKKKNFVALIPMQKERKKNCGCNAKRKKKKFVAGDAVFL